MSGYLDFERTGHPAFDAVLDAIENAGSMYHHTSQWAEGGFMADENEKTQLELINEKIADLRALIANSPQADGMVLTSEMISAGAVPINNWNNRNRKNKTPISPMERAIAHQVFDAMKAAYKPQADDVRKDAETAWLVEKDIGGFPNYLYCDCIGLLSWTPSNQKAMRFARREDAESMVSIVEDADRVAQHMWAPPLDKARE